MFAFDIQRFLNRRLFLQNGSAGIGLAALATLLERDAKAANRLPAVPHFPPKAKRVIWLTQAGAPSQLDLFDCKPHLQERFNEDLPASVRGSQRLTGMTSGQARLPIAPSRFRFRRHGESGIWLSELLPHTGRIADRLCMIRSLYTEAINHDPAMTMLQTGHQIAGRPSLGAWLSYGLGSENDNLPALRGDDLPSERPDERSTLARTDVGSRLSCRPATRGSASVRERIRCCFCRIRPA